MNKTANPTTIRVVALFLFNELMVFNLFIEHGEK